MIAFNRARRIFDYQFNYCKVNWMVINERSKQWIITLLKLN